MNKIYKYIKFIKLSQRYPNITFLKIAINKNNPFEIAKKRFISQGFDDNIVNDYVNKFENIKNKFKYKLNNDSNIDITVPLDKRHDISAYQNFLDLEKIVNYMDSQVNINPKENVVINDKPINNYNNSNIKIYLGENQDGCIHFSNGYDWCIGRKDHANLFGHYKYSKDEPTFYFVKDENRTKEDPYHYFILQVTKDYKYIITHSQDIVKDTTLSWDEILKLVPDLKNFKDVFKYIPISQEEKNFYEKYKGVMTNEIFKHLSYSEKDKYLDMFSNKLLSDEQFSYLPDYLKNKYISSGRLINDNNYSLIKDNNKLLKSYNRNIAMKMKNIIKDEISLRYLANNNIKTIIESNDKNILSLKKEFIQHVSESSNSSYDYAKNYKNIEDIPFIIIESIAEDPMNASFLARDFHFNKIPNIIIQSISKNIKFSYNYARYVDFQQDRIPYLIVEAISKDINYCKQYIDNVKNIKDVPLPIIQSIKQKQYKYQTN